VSGDSYKQIIEAVFLERYTEGDEEVLFSREDLQTTSDAIGVRVPKNLGDIVYAFRYRRPMPEEIERRAPNGKSWVIRGRGTARYAFVAVPSPWIVPNPHLAEIKVPDATPGIIAKHALTSEQALLAKLRYNRLVDIFSGVTCYSLQNHLRTQVEGIGQLETDEIYLGVDRRGAHYAFPVEAKGGKDKLGIVQVDQDLELCRAKFPSLICRPIAAQFMGDDLIALFLFEEDERGYAVMVGERHYRLVPHSSISREELEAYRASLDPP
jgi:hypothetical protein